MSLESNLHNEIGDFKNASNRQSANVSPQAVPFILAAADLIFILFCGSAESVLYQLAAGNGFPDLRPQLAVGLLAGLFYVLQMSRTGFYELPAAATEKLEARNIVVAWVTTALILAFVAFLLKVGDAFSRGTFVLSFFITPVALLGVRKLSKFVLARAISSGAVGRPDTVLLGELNEILALQPRDLLAACGATEINRFTLSRDCNRDVRNAADARTIKRLADFVRRHHCRQILLALPWSDSERLDLVRDEMKALPVAVRLLPDLRARSLASLTWPGRHRTLAIDVQRAPLSGAQRFLKRLLDLLVCSLALVFFLPMMVLTAIAIKVDSSGPVVFRQLRRGFNGEQFLIFKFRTMTVEENGSTVVQATRDDARVTNLGRLLRSSSIDELPQLFNVLRGEMSLVGPRPHALAHDTYFESLLSDYAFRHHVKPGITGWAQCNGARGATPSIEDVAKRVKFDLWYIDNWSFWLDIQILIKTAFEVVKKHNAY